MTYSSGKIQDVAIISTLQEDGSVKEKIVKKGDALSSIVLSAGAYGETETIDAATVVGFTAKPLDVKRGSTRVYDTVPTYLFDPDNADGFWGTVSETMAVRQVVLQAAPIEGGEGSVRIVNVDQIKSFEGGKDPEEEDD